MSFARQVGNCLAIVCVFKSRAPWAWRCPKSSKVCFPGSQVVYMGSYMKRQPYQGSVVSMFNGFFLLNFIRLYLGKWSKLTFLFLANMGLKLAMRLYSSWTDEKKDVWTMTGNENSQPRDVFCCSFNFGLTSFWFEPGLLLYLIKKILQTNYQFDIGSEYSTILCYLFLLSGKKKCLNTKIPKHQQSTRWWFQIVFIFTPTWGNDPIWRSRFSNGLKPATRSKWFP